MLPCLAVAAVTAFPAVLLCCRNDAEASFSEVAPFLFGNVAVVLVLFAGLAALTKKPGKAVLAASLFIFLMMTFSYVEKVLKLVLPSLKYWHTVPIVVVAALHIVDDLTPLGERDVLRYSGALFELMWERGYSICEVDFATIRDKYLKDYIFCFFDNNQYEGGMLERLSFEGWALCDTTEDASDRYSSLILNSN